MYESTGNKFFKLEHRITILIFIALAAWLVFGVSVEAWAMMPCSVALASKIGLDLTIIASLAAGITGCSIYYTRKLYKWCINADIGALANFPEDCYRQIGLIVYYMLRPLLERRSHCSWWLRSRLGYLQ